MFRNLRRRRVIHTGGLFNGHLIDVRNFYVASFGNVPCVTFIGDIDTTKAYQHIKQTYQIQIADIYQHRYYDHDRKEMFFNNTIFVLHDRRMIEIGNNWCQILHTDQQYGWAAELVGQMAGFRVVAAAPPEKRVIGFARQQDMN